MTNDTTKEIHLIFKIFSPTFWFYDQIKKEFRDAYKKNEKMKKEIKIFNARVAENIKLLYLMIAINVIISININFYINNYKYIDLFENILQLVFLATLVVATVICSRNVKFHKSEGSRARDKVCSYSYNFFVDHPYKFNMIIWFIFAIIKFIIISKYSILQDVFLIILCIYFGVSRVLHLHLVFVLDTFKTLKKGTETEKSEIGVNDESTTLTRKIYIVLMSYLSLILEYSILYFILANKFGMFKYEFHSMIEAIYFSTVTITTIGYGDFFPTHNFGQIMVMMQIISGMFLLIVTLVTYMNEKA